MSKFWQPSRFGALLLTVLAVLSSLAITRAQQPATTPINGVWDNTIGNSLQTPGSINKLYIGPDQRLYVAGNFAYLNNQLGNGLVSWDGTNWHSHGLQANDINSIKTFETYQNQLIIGGSFQNLAGRGINGVGRWDGSQFQGFGAGTQGSNDYWGNTPSQVNDFAVISDTLYLAGNFSQFDTIAANSVAYWKPTGIGALGSFDNKALVAASTGQQLFVGGAFQYINNVEIPFFARFANGHWSSMPMPSGIGVNPQWTTGLNNAIYAWGYLLSNPKQHYVYRYSNNQWSMVGNDLPSLIDGIIDANGLYAYNNRNVWKLVNNQWQQVVIPASISSITAVAGTSNQLYLAGQFVVNNQPSQLIAWDGTSVTSLATTTLPPAIADVGGLNGKLVINRGGNTNLQQWNGSSWQQLYSMSQGSRMVTVDSQHTYLTSGYPFSPNNGSLSALWEFSSTGTLTNPVAINGTAINWTRSGPSLLANGSTGTINGQVYSTTVQINQDHSWQQFNVRHYDNQVRIYFVNNQYYAVKLLSEPYSTIILIDIWRNNSWQERDGIQVGNETDVQFVVWRDRLYISGSSGLYQLNDDGNIVQIAQFNNLVKRLASVDDEYLYVAGKFTAVNQQTTGSVARWDGMIWQGLAAPVNGAVEHMAVTSDDLYLAGNFTHAGAIPSLGVAHLSVEYQPPSNTVTPSNTPTITNTPTTTVVPSNTATPTTTAVPSNTPTTTAVPSNTATPTTTAVPSNTPTNIPTSTAEPTTIPSQTYSVFIAYVVK